MQPLFVLNLCCTAYCTCCVCENRLLEPNQNDDDDARNADDDDDNGCLLKDIHPGDHFAFIFCFLASSHCMYHKCSHSLIDISDSLFKLIDPFQHPDIE